MENFSMVVNKAIPLKGASSWDPAWNGQDDKPCGSMIDVFRHPTWNWDDDDENEDDDDSKIRSPNRSFGYDIFSNPPEIHRHFQQEMEEISRVFNMFGNMFGGDFFRSQPPISDPDHYQGKENLRDRYLKPKYWHDSHESEWSSGNATRKGQLDNDLDDRVSAGELDEILKDKPSMEKYEPQAQIRISGKRSFSKIITNSDGTTEYYHTVRDSEGNEATTVTQQIGDQRYSVTTHTDFKGEKQQTERFKNIEKDDLDTFKKKWSKLHQAPLYPRTDKEPKPNDLSIFDHFFK
ncbi:hypothetical protein Cfor_02400 [Coptotermes formosanus]|uniref:HCLS1-associated protein X-1 n=1 Tax=Coptotermes formosanus TaxID=36987 RepID=A0A6L2PY23_COPFO|nr:hypothetical protein Cfor_02400 [Coptotermes formosanus]